MTESKTCKHDYVLYSLLYTIFKAFVSTVDYNSAERYMLKLFLDVCADSFKSILNIEHTVRESVGLYLDSNNQFKIPFFLEIFECHFSTKIEHPKYDIKQEIESSGFISAEFLV